MAGAVSAGAYTAGVMDYLIEALQTWDDKKQNPGGEEVPTHEVLIKAIGGASAGGMTGIIAASALNNTIEPVKKADASDLLKEYPNNKFYNAWVDLLQKDMFPLMLETDDIKRGKIYSLLNSEFIDKVGEKSLKVSPNSIQRNYVEKHLKVFTTLTNLEGFKYNTNFIGEADDNEYHLSHHADYAAFVLNKDESQYNDDGWVPLDFFKNINTKMALDAAMATGAFPVGLRSRKITRAKKYVQDLSWNRPLLEKFDLGSDPYEALIVDGGVINNEPFERVKSLINQGDDAKNEDKNTFEGTTIMIDPFPSYKTEFDILTDGMTSIIGKTISAMLGHLRSKPEVFQRIGEGNDGSQYQIAPVRYDKNDKKIEGEKAIACGFLGGFGGFIHKEFRVHDFFLGRANCEHFLREHFTVDADTSNPIFKNGYSNVAADKFVSSSGKRQIIPIFTPRANKMYMPVFENGNIWPTRKDKDIKRFRPGLRRRAGKVILNISDFGWGTRLLLGIGNQLFIRRKMAKAVYNSIESSMKEHKLL
jgi:hypothetical protein